LTACAAAALLAGAAAPAAHAAVTVGGVSVSEGDGVATASFTVTRTAGLLTGQATIHFATADGSARAPGDYEAISGDLQFGSLPLGGTQVQTVPVTVQGDRLDEADETLHLVLSGSPEIVAGAGEAVATILDDDPPPVVGVLDAPAAAEGAGATFTIALSAPSGRDVAVAFTTADDTAIAGEDYTPRSGTLGIPAGATSVTLGVPLLDDGADEPDEAFELRIGFAVLATIGRATAGATIADNDDPPPPAAADPAGSETPPAGAGAGAGAASPLPGGPSAEPPSAASASPVALGLSSPRLRRPAIVLVTVSCPRQTSRCAGRVTIFSRPVLRSKIKALRRERRLGQRNFTLASGVTRTLTIALSRTDRVLLTRAGRMLVRAYAVTRDGGGRSAVRRTTGTLIARTSHS
jgi:hypothetical protein